MEIPNHVFGPVGASAHAAHLGVADDFDARFNYAVAVLKVEQQAGLVRSGKGVTVKTNPCGSRELGKDVIFVKPNAVVSCRGLFVFLLKR